MVGPRADYDGPESTNTLEPFRKARTALQYVTAHYGARGTGGRNYGIT